MKNEADETAIKHKNEDLFKELDKDNDYYNVDIVDVSYKCEKIYVIRPQSFITIINIL